MVELIEQIRRFAEDRDWEQYHSPKNLAMGLSVEVAEIVEIFQWLTEEESRVLDEETLDHLEQELGDVMIFLVSLADKLGLDPLQAAEKKLAINAKKYPASLVRGKAKKYTDY